MQMPFTTDQFFDVFRRYNEAVWPLQWVFVAAAVAAVAIAFRPRPQSARAVGALLAVLWLWMGAVYHLTFFRAINPAATAFGVLFLAQGALFAWFGVKQRRLAFQIRPDLVGVAGGVLIAYAIVVYPALGYLLGHRYPAAPTFGLPCPTTIFTFGLLLWTLAPMPRTLLVIPALWAAVGAVAAVQLGVPEDLGLPIAAVVALWGQSHNASFARTARPG